jgi:hypothetical protein
VDPKPGFAPPENQAVQRWALEATNEPADGNKVPFQHHRPEEIMQSRLGVGQGPIGSDHPASSANAYLANQPGLNHNSPGHFQTDQQGNMYNKDQGQSEMSTNPAPDADKPPTFQGSGPSDGGRADRDLWY